MTFKKSILSTDAFSEKVVNDFSGTMVSTMCILGDRLGLFKELATNGPATSSELAQRADVNERYTREWLQSLACVGYLTYDSTNQRFTLPTEYIPVLAEENGPYFMGGPFQQMLGLWGALDQVEQAFVKGGGVPYSAYSEHWWHGLARESHSWFDNALVQEWIPVMPVVKNQLEQGIMVADVGCGYGRALIQLAKAFPKSQFVGYDLHEGSINAAIQAAKDHGVEKNVTFKQLDIANELPSQYDLITTFDVIHDLSHPKEGLKAIRNALKSTGSYILMEINSKDQFEENFGVMGTIMYGYSVLACMATALLDQGVGLGTLGLPPGKVKEYCLDAGFTTVIQLPIEDEYHTLFEVRP
ncbi:MAG: class I SAM-dependent methyltransferase [Candidatus Hodarchaeales archaeon]|jgi:2-polyprenyl-3-methyl-5-hydroxy-6-metoxy-1,4-benzoquinol methylase